METVSKRFQVTPSQGEYLEFLDQHLGVAPRSQFIMESLMHGNQTPLSIKDIGSVNELREFIVNNPMISTHCSRELVAFVLDDLTLDFKSWDSIDKSLVYSVENGMVTATEFEPQYLTCGACFSTACMCRFVPFMKDPARFFSFFLDNNVELNYCCMIAVKRYCPYLWNSFRDKKLLPLLASRREFYFPMCVCDSAGPFRPDPLPENSQVEFTTPALPPPIPGAVPCFPSYPDHKIPRCKKYGAYPDKYPSIIMRDPFHWKEWMIAMSDELEAIVPTKTPKEAPTQFLGFGRFEYETEDETFPSIVAYFVTRPEKLNSLNNFSIAAMEYTPGHSYHLANWTPVYFWSGLPAYFLLKANLTNPTFNLSSQYVTDLPRDWILTYQFVNEKSSDNMYNFATDLIDLYPSLNGEMHVTKLKVYRQMDRNIIMDLPCYTWNNCPAICEAPRASMIVLENQSLGAGSQEISKTFDEILRLFDKIKPATLIFHLARALDAFMDGELGVASSHLLMIAEVTGFVWNTDYSIYKVMSCFIGWLRMDKKHLDVLEQLELKPENKQKITVMANESVGANPSPLLLDLLTEKAKLLESLPGLAQTKVQSTLNSFTESEHLETVISIGSLILSALAYSVLPEDIEKWLNKLGKFSNSWQKISTFSQGPNGVIRSFIGHVTGKELDPKKAKADYLRQRTLELQKDLTDIIKAMKVSMIAVLANPNVFNNLEKRQDKILSDLLALESQGITLPALRFNLDTIFKEMTWLKTYLDSVAQSKHGKCRPTVLWMGGEPGVGKSKSVQLIVEALSKLEDRPLTTYYRGVSDDYWSKYAGQDIVVYDDFGSNITNLDHMELRDIYTPATYPLNMADLSEKGTSFQSRYVIICSNQIHISKSNSLSPPSLLWRRRDFVFEVKYSGDVFGEDHDQSLVSYERLRRHPKDYNTYTDSNGQLITALPCITAQVDGYKHHMVNQKGKPIKRLDSIPYGSTLTGTQGPKAMAKLMFECAKPRVAEFSDATQELIKKFQLVMRNEAFCEVNENDSFRVPLLIGPPGVGKTQLAQKLKLNIVDDKHIGVDAGKSYFEDITSAYTQRQQAFWVLNPEPLFDYLDELTPQQVDMFYRRVEIFEIDFQVKSRNFLGKKSYYKREDIDWSNPDMYLKFTQNEVKKSRAQFVEAITKFNTTTTEESHYVKQIPVKDVKDADVIIELGATIADLVEQKMTVPNLATLNFKKGIRHLPKFKNYMKEIHKLGHAMPAAPRALDLANAINNCKIKGQHDISILVHGKDESIIISVLRDQPVFCGIVVKDANWYLSEDAVFLDDEKVLPSEDVFIRKHLIKFNQLESGVTMENSQIELGVDSSLVDMLLKGAMLLITTLSAAGAVYKALKYDTIKKPDATLIEESTDNLKGSKGDKIHRSMRVYPSMTRESATPYSEGRLVESTELSPKEIIPPILASEASRDSVCDDIRPKVLKNVVKIFRESQFECFGIVVSHGVLVTVGHLRGNLTMRGKDSKSSIPLTFSKRLDNRDGAIYTFVDKSCTYANIIKHLGRKEDMLNVTVEGVLDLYKQTLKSFESNPIMFHPPSKVYRTNNLERTQQLMSKRDSDPNSLTSEEQEYLKMPTFYDRTYKSFSPGASLSTNKGDCGSPAFVKSSRFRRKLWGIHAASITTIGQICSVFQEDFDDFTFMENESATPFEPVSSLESEQVQEIQREMDIKVVGYVVDEFGKRRNISNAPGTQLRKSPMRGDLQPTGEPSLLSQKDPRINGKNVNLRDDAILKWNKPKSPNWDESLIVECFEEIGDHLAQLMHEKNVEVEICSEEDVINGIPGRSESHGLNRKTSAGLPWKFGPCKKKEDFFDVSLTGKASFNSQATSLRENIERFTQMLARGEEIPVVFDASLKDEVLPMRKIYDTPKTRSFAACTMEYLYLARKYTHSAVSGLLSIRDVTPFAIGMDVTSPEWEHMWQDFWDFSEIGFDADFSGYDSSVPDSFIGNMYIVYNKIYQKNSRFHSKKHDLIRKQLYQSIRHPKVSLGSLVLEFPGGQMSGQPNTAIDNSIINCAYHLYAYKKIMTPVLGKIPHMTDFLKNVKTKSFGDDVINAIKPEIAEHFNFVSMKNLFEDLGIVMTPSQKTEKGIALMATRDMTFLKGTPVIYHHTRPMILFQLDNDSINKQICWTRVHKALVHDADREVEFELDVIQTSFSSLAYNLIGHPKEYFEIMSKVRSNLLKFPEMSHIDLTIPAWEDLVVEKYFSA